MSPARGGEAAPAKAVVPAKAPPRPKAARVSAHRFPGALARYFHETRTPLYSAMMVLPLLFFYSLGGVFLNWEVVNGVDFVTPLLLAFAGPKGILYLNLGVFVVAAAVAGWLRVKGRAIQWDLLAPMVLESLVYAFVMGALILLLLEGAAQWMATLQAALTLATGAPPELGGFEKVVLSAGAGFFEELVFRLILLGATRWLLHRLLGMGPRLSWVLAVVGTSLLFSLAHFLGPESFDLYALAYRTLAGVYFATIFGLRGFAVAAWTHALYDMIVLFGR